jgi:hypothetical protein
MAGCLLCLLAEPAAAQEPLERNDFNIDAFTGPVLGSSRVVGLGGAYTALATDIDGAHWNPASFGSRPPYELDWFEYGLSLSYFAPGLFGADDFFNNGSGINVDGFSFLSLGLRFQFGNFGFGGDTRTQMYQTGLGDDEVDILLLESHLGIAYAFYDGQIILGLGARVVNLDINLPDNTTLTQFTGAGVEGGLLLKLEDFPWRLGVAGRGPVESHAELVDGVEVVDGVKTVRGIIIPNKVYMPWQVQIGFAWQFGARPLNRKWVPAEEPQDNLEAALERARCQRAAAQLAAEAKAHGRELTGTDLCPDLPEQPQDADWWRAEEKLRQAEDEELEKEVESREDEIDEKRRNEYRAIPRPYWLVSADLILTGPTSNGIGVDGFVEQLRRESGEDLSVGFHMGAETELVDNRLKLRAGFYLEPARNENSVHRPHGTAGLELRLFAWDFFGCFRPFDIKVSLTVDGAARYLDIGVGIGVWH